MLVNLRRKESRDKYQKLESFRTRTATWTWASERFVLLREDGEILEFGAPHRQYIFGLQMGSEGSVGVIEEPHVHHLEFAHG